MHMYTLPSFVLIFFNVEERYYRTSDNETNFGGGPQCKKVCFNGQHHLQSKLLDLIVGVETFAILLILLGDTIR